MNKTLKDKIKRRWADWFDDANHLNDIKCGDGWFSLIWNLFEELDKDDVPSGFKVNVVKENYGALVVKTTTTTPRISKLIESAADRSLHTCEICGSRIERTTDSISTKCAVCSERFNPPE